MNVSDVITKGGLPGLKEKRCTQKRNIVSFLYRQGDLSKPEMCRLTNMTAPTIGRMLEELMAEGWVIDLGCGTSGGGKRPHIFSLKRDAAFVLGVDVGREYLKVALFDLKHEVVGRIFVYPSRLEVAERDDVLNDIAGRVEDTLAFLGVERSRIRVAGVSLPGLIDREGNTYTYLTYENPGLKERLGQLLEMPVFIDNDSNAIAVAEHAFGVAKGINNVLCISINECVGLGMILDSRLYVGGNGMAGEFGHIRISGLDTPCQCGKVGCLETVASSRAIVKAAKERMVKMLDGESVTLEGVIRAARKDELSAIELLQQVGEKVGEGIASLLHLFNPDMVVLGGEIVKAGDLITVPVRQAMNKYALARIRGHCELRLSDLGGDAAILGTQLMAMGHLHQKTGMTFALYE